MRMILELEYDDEWELTTKTKKSTDRVSFSIK